MRVMMLKNYCTTSVRNLNKNRFFSTLNIAGLAIAMTLGLLLIAMITELDTFDKFHVNANRIFRLESKWKSPEGSVYDYASSSLYAAQQLKETVSGIDNMAIVTRTFDGDIRYNEKTVPLKGHWANESFLEIFSFGVIAGNPATALKEPFSIVLTESSARKIFGSTDIIGKQVQLDTANYVVTGITHDVPMNSHIRFDMLGSFSTIDNYKTSTGDKNWNSWESMWRHHIYLLLPENENQERFATSLASICNQANKTLDKTSIQLYLKPLTEIAFSKNISNSLGPNIDRSMSSDLAVFATIVILSACFNYTNLSIARALRRTKEVGIRKSVGASGKQVFHQFIVEAIVISLLSVGISFLLFLLARTEFFKMTPILKDMVTLKPTLKMWTYFVVLAIAVGFVAGFLPALFFSKINAIQVLKNFSSVKLFSQIKLRRALIVFQFTLSLLFIVAVTLAYKQYRYALNFDLGFTTENVLEVRLQGNKSDLMMKEFNALPEVKQVSRSLFVSSAHTSYSGVMKFEDSATFYYNHVDENYLSLHDHKLLAGRNFLSSTATDKDVPEVIVNEQTVKWMKLPSPHVALGKEIIVDGRKTVIIGVVKDFNHNQVNYPIKNFGFLNDQNKFSYLNVKIESTDMLLTTEKLRTAWKKIDTVHPLDAKFHSDIIRQSYDKLEWVIKLFGSVAVLAVSIASLGLLGMVVFTTETKLKEISIRKVLGATEAHLVFLLGKGFIVLVIISSIIAVPAAYWFFDRVAFARIVYRVPINMFDLLSGAFAVLVIAFVLIGSQTLKASRTNPAQVLKSE